MRADTAFSFRFYRALSMFLADRMRSMTSQVAYGISRPDHVPDPDELDEGVLDTVHLAGSRFDRMLRRLSGG